MTKISQPGSLGFTLTLFFVLLSIRVVFAFGGIIEFPVMDITPTCLTPLVIHTLREVDSLANQVLHSSGETGNLSQIPLVLIPIHFDRSHIERSASFQRSVSISKLYKTAQT